MPKTTRKKKPAKAAESARPLRLEWVEAGSLDANPRNWRRHPVGQMDALRESLGDGEIGWAGALLFNETTGHLIDGHARKEAVDPETLVPVLIGSWSAGAERKILLTLDPITAMAEADGEALRGLLSETAFETAGLQGVLDGLWAAVKAGTEPDADEWKGALDKVPEGGGSGFRQMTFTLAEAQVEVVLAAIKRAKAAGPFAETGNENSNGNALARIAEAYAEG